MPASSKKQQRFFQLIRGIQTGKVDKNKVSVKVKKAAKSISAQDAHDFATGKIKKEGKSRVLKILKEIIEPTYLQEEKVNPIAKSFTQKGIFDEYILKFKGLPFSPKELESVNNYSKTKPSTTSKDLLKYEVNDEFNNNMTTVIKKLKNGQQFVYTSFSKVDKTNEEEQPSDSEDINPENPSETEPESKEQDDITVTKSATFDNDIKGGEILFDFLTKLDI